MTTAPNLAADPSPIGKSRKAAFALAGKLDARVAANAQAWMVGFEALPNGAKSRDAVLPDAQAAAIVAEAYAVSDRFGVYVQAHAETGARTSQLTRCIVADFLAGEGKLMIPNSRKGRNGGRGGHTAVPLAAGLSDRLREAVAGRFASEPLFLRRDGRPYDDDDHEGAIQERHEGPDRSGELRRRGQQGLLGHVKATRSDRRDQPA